MDIRKEILRPNKCLKNLEDKPVPSSSEETWYGEPVSSQYEETWYGEPVPSPAEGSWNEETLLSPSKQQNDGEQDGVEAESQPTPSHEHKVQLRQPQSTDDPPKVKWCPGEEDHDGEQESKNCCQCCFYRTILCFDLLSIL